MGVGVFNFKCIIFICIVAITSMAISKVIVYRRTEPYPTDGKAGKPVLRMVTQMSVWGQCAPRSWHLIQYVGDPMCRSPNKRPNGSKVTQSFNVSYVC